MPYANMSERYEYHAHWLREKRRKDPAFAKRGVEQVQKYRCCEPEKYMLRNTRRRAKQKGIPFALTLVDIVIPARCPVLDIPLFMGTTKDHRNAPSIDRIVPALGYVPSNVRVISHRANNLRSNGTAAELKKVAEDAARLEEANG